MKKILLDTNMLLAPVQFRAGVYEQLAGKELLTLDSCLKELEKLSERGSKTGLQARAALLLAKMKDVHIVKAKSRSTDKALIAAAEENGCAVATNDRVLIKALKKLGIKVLRLKQKKLVVEG